MAPNEAMDYMENKIRCIQRARYCEKDCDKCKLAQKDKSLIEALGAAIIALEKQIPKKVRHIEEKNRPAQGYAIVASECPCCKQRQKKHHKYCPICGQALDWS